MDPALVDAARSRDEEAFASIARRSADRLFAVAHRILRDAGRAEDAVQAGVDEDPMDPGVEALALAQPRELAPGGDEGLLRNEGTVPAETIAVQIVASGAPRRIDMPAPGNCPF